MKMIHPITQTVRPTLCCIFLREDSVTKAIAGYTDIENVPKRNIAFTKEKGLAYMQQLLKSI